MFRTLSLTLAVIVGAGLTAASAKGYLAKKPQKLPELKIGLGQAGYGMSEKLYELETGKSYRLKITSTGAKECALEAPEFFSSIWLRKVEAGDMEIKAPTVTELEYEDEGEAEIFFVPIKPGNYEMACSGLEEKGMVVNIKIE